MGREVASLCLFTTASLVRLLGILHTILVVPTSSKTKLFLAQLRHFASCSVLSSFEDNSVIISLYVSLSIKAFSRNLSLRELTYS